MIPRRTSVRCKLFGHRFDIVSAVHVEHGHPAWAAGACADRFYIELHCVRCSHTRRQYIKPPHKWKRLPVQRYHHGHNNTRPKKRP